LGADFEMWEYRLAVYNTNERKQTGEDEILIEVCKLIPSEKWKEAILKMINNNLRNGSIIIIIIMIIKGHLTYFSFI